MDDITVENLTKRFGDSDAVADVNFRVERGEMLVLLGPSGCGKSTTLRCVAGLEQPTSGRITFGDRVVYDRSKRVNMPPQDRDLGFVFQTFALWPHMTARENIGFPLGGGALSKAERAARVQQVAQTVDLGDDLLKKRPNKLSGGQQQRVALARALVSEPGVVLFDEPLSNLDASLRSMLRIELRALHDRIGFTGIYVTHDLTEGATLGDRVAVMRRGGVEQVGTTAEVFGRPATTQVAGLVGFREVCVVRRATEGWTTGLDCVSFRGPEPTTVQSGTVRLYASPDQLVLRPAGADADASLFAIDGAVLEQKVFVGRGTELVVRLGEQRLRLPGTAAHAQLDAGDAVSVGIPDGEVHCYDEQGNRLELESVFGRRMPGPAVAAAGLGR